MSPAAAVEAVDQAIVAWDWRPSFSLTRVPLQVTGSVHGYWMQVWAFRRGERMPYRPTITGQFAPASDGSIFTGAVTFPRVRRELLIAWSCIVALAVVAGLVGLIGDAASGHPHKALHWLPLVIVPVAMALFAIGIYAASKTAARARAAYLRQWLTERLLVDAPGT